MSKPKIPTNSPSNWRDRLILDLITMAVIINGLAIIAGNLTEQLRIHNNSPASLLLVTLPLVSGLTLVYLGTLLYRRKRAAWAVVIPVYTFILGTSLAGIDDFHGLHRTAFLLRNILVPMAVVLVLLYFRNVFTVKSNIQNFRYSLSVTLLILLIALVYGVAGFTLMDQHDFHKEISIGEAVHRTVDQFDLTTNSQLTAYTKRATFFIDSLNLMSVVAVGYGFISLFQPLKAKLTSQTLNRQLVEEMLRKSSSTSEDFFKLWPHDKIYFFANDNQAAIAYRVQNGIALVVGEPAGQASSFPAMLQEFGELCRVNDWLPAFVHITSKTTDFLELQGFQLQKIGEEAVVNIDHFNTNVANEKYFRQIKNKFASHHYSAELLTPPHNQAVIERLSEISGQWLEGPGRQERGFMMGHFSVDYMQLCSVLVARDAAGTIQGFLSQIPTFQSRQASYDLLRHTTKALSNVNDFLLMSFMDMVQQQGFSELNLGLCPLSGLEGSSDDNKSLIDTTLRFVYANGDRFYSFSGLHRFKSKYKPDWQPRYVAFKGGLRGFSRTVIALNKAMNRLK